MEIIFEFDPSSEEVDSIERKLFQFNSSKIDNYSYENFVIKAVDDSGSLIAGLHGQVGGGWLCISSLWVNEKYRRQGLGKRLVSLAEETAIKKECHGVYLYTYSFQSSTFYEKLGYRIFGTLENFFNNHAKHFMKKSLV